MKTLSAAQQQAHDRLMQTLSVKTHVARPPEPRPYDIARREAATAKMMQTRKL